MGVNRFVMRAVRKSAHIGNKAILKAHRFTSKVEQKSTRILDGVDFSVSTHETIPLEKIYYNSLELVTPINPAMPAIGSKPTVTLFIPSLNNGSFFGGTATALVFAAKLALEKKRNLKIVQTLQEGHVEDLESFFRQEGIPISSKDISIVSVAGRAYNLYGYVAMHPEDIFIASAWWDAHLIGKLPVEKFIYLIQDFEPIFYNNSDLYVMAENTYKQTNFIPVCNTHLMYEFMRERNYAAFQSKKAYWFEPAVSRAGESKVDNTSKKRKFFLYGRPNVHRNLFFTALESIDYAFKAGFLNPSDWELFMAGQDGIPEIKLSSGPVIKNLGKMPMDKYVDFCRKVDLAVSPMMAPHPNYPTLEFASVGSAVVTTKYANKQDLSNYSKNIFMADIDVESIAGAILKAAELSPKDRLDTMKSNKISNSWNTSLDSIIKDVSKSF